MKPTKTVILKDNCNETWYELNGILHRDDGPAYIEEFHNGEYYEEWLQDGKKTSLWCPGPVI